VFQVEHISLRGVGGRTMAVAQQTTTHQEVRPVNKSRNTMHAVRLAPTTAEDIAVHRGCGPNIWFCAMRFVNPTMFIFADVQEQ